MTTEWHLAGQLGWKQDEKAGVPSQTHIIAAVSVILVSRITSVG